MKRNFILLLLASMGVVATAQTASEAGYTKKVIAECQRLHSDGEYSTALTLIEKVDTRNLDERTMQEFKLLKALTTFENNHHEGKALLMQYMADYPNSSQKEVINSYIAQSHYFDGDFEGACALFADSDPKRLPRQERERADFYHALSMLECGQEGNAVDMLQRLKAGNGQYADDATFHLAVIDYDNGRLNEAYKAFKSIQMGKEHYLDVPYYLAGIELKKGNSKSAGKIAERFIKDHSDKAEGSRMKQILGAAQFADGNYKDAAVTLTEYLNEYPTPQRIALYQLALSLYKEGNYENAKTLFDQCTSLDDELTQNAFLHKGMIALEQNDANGARLAFELASQMNHNDALREEALYNYALCLHKGNHSAFGEGVKTFEKFLNEYPDSRHASTIAGQLVNVYMNTKNYDVALESINKINEPSDEILKAKQKILYRLGVQEFINEDYKTSIDYMNSSLELAKYDQETKSDALFWKGEALFKTGDLTNAEKAYRQVAAMKGNNRNKALYNIGFLQFQEEEYDNARASFEKFVSNAKGESSDIVADAYSRIGDCYYYQRQFTIAKQYYDKASGVDSKNADYSLFRSAITMGMAKGYSSKASTLKQLVTEHPDSKFAEQAYYELGRTYVEQGKYGEAIETFDELVKRFPTGQLARRAATEKAMIYNNNGDYANAIDAYKSIIELYPHTDESQLALQDLRNIYIEQGNIKAYADYVANTDGLKKVNSTDLDTLAYTTAERFYGKRDLSNAKLKFQEYLDEFGDGAFRLNSHYYLGVIQHQEKEYDAAIVNLEAVLAYPSNKFREEALIRAGEIYYNKGEYEKVIPAYKEVAEITLDDVRRTTAHINILRAAKKTGSNEDVISSAGQLAANSNVEPAWRREAVFSRAKAYMALDSIECAIDDLEPLAKDTRTKEGAESKYLLAELLFNQEQYEECEEEVFEYIEMSTPHAYWLARSFILLSDVYVKTGRTMEAKEYLVSLKNNYEPEDDIQGMIQERLSRIENNNNE